MNQDAAIDRSTAEKSADPRPNLNYGLAAEVWADDDVATALDRWREKQHKAPGRPRGGRE